MTQGTEGQVMVSKKFLQAGDRVLILDDIMANGCAMQALISLVEDADAVVEGCGVVIEKAFQEGGHRIRNLGYRLEALAVIEAMDPATGTVVFQEDRLLPWLTLADNVCLPLPKEKRDEAKKLLNEIGLAESADKYPAAVSGGMRRRVALVRALAYAGDALLLDEPFNGLDAENRALAAAMVRREFLDRGKPVLLISHIPEDAELLNAEIVYMD